MDGEQKYQLGRVGGEETKDFAHILLEMKQESARDTAMVSGEASASPVNRYDESVADQVCLDDPAFEKRYFGQFGVSSKPSEPKN